MDPDEPNQSVSGANPPLGGSSASAENRTNPVEASDSSKECSQAPNMDPKNLHYEGDVCVYTDPETKYQYQWDNDTQQWTPRGQQPKAEDASKEAKPPGGELKLNV